MKHILGIPWLTYKCSSNTINLVCWSKFFVLECCHISMGKKNKNKKESYSYCDQMQEIQTFSEFQRLELKLHHIRLQHVSCMI